MEKIEVKQEYLENSNELHSPQQNGSNGSYSNNTSLSFNEELSIKVETQVKGETQVKLESQPEVRSYVENQRDGNTIPIVRVTHCLTEHIAVKHENHRKSKPLLERHEYSPVCDVVDTVPVPGKSGQTQCLQNLVIKQEPIETVIDEEVNDEHPCNLVVQYCLSNEVIAGHHGTKDKLDLGHVIADDRAKEKQVKNEDSTVPCDDINTQIHWKVVDYKLDSERPDPYSNSIEADQPNIQVVSENMSSPLPEDLTDCENNLHPVKIDQVDFGSIESEGNTHEDHSSSKRKDEIPNVSTVYGYNQSSNLNNYVAINTSLRPIFCKECAKGLKCNLHRNDNINIHTIEMPFMCEVCNRRFSQSSALESHMIVHRNEMKFMCEECGRMFCQSSHLETHMVTHTDQKPFICNVCGLGINHKSRFEQHMRIHTNEKIYVCKICGNGFNRMSNLKAHVVTHKDERPFICKVCGKGFSQNGVLTKHMVVHSTEKPFVCKECGKGFSQNSTLKRHMLLIHEDTKERPFICKECGKGFRQKSHLKEHMAIHAKERPFVCKVCGKGCNQSGTLKRHMQTHVEGEQI